MHVKLRLLSHAKFQPSSAEGTYSNWRLNGEV